MKIPKSYTKSKTLFLNQDEPKYKWEFGCPNGITLHYSADDNLHRVIAWLTKIKLNYHCVIERSGGIYQTASFDAPVAHAGNALWNKKSPNKNFISICLLSWGKLEKYGNDYFAWNKTIIPDAEIIQKNNSVGTLDFWHKATDKQESSLMELLSWLVSYDINPENICGHDECCIPRGRKQDPGGILSISTSQIRKILKTNGPNGELR